MLKHDIHHVEKYGYSCEDYGRDNGYWTAFYSLCSRGADSRQYFEQIAANDRPEPINLATAAEPAETDGPCGSSDEDGNILMDTLTIPISDPQPKKIEKMGLAELLEEFDRLVQASREYNKLWEQLQKKFPQMYDELKYIDNDWNTLRTNAPKNARSRKDVDEIERDADVAREAAIIDLQNKYLGKMPKDFVEEFHAARKNEIENKTQRDRVENRFKAWDWEILAKARKDFKNKKAADAAKAAAAAEPAEAAEACKVAAAEAAEVGAAKAAAAAAEPAEAAKAAKAAAAEAAEAAKAK
jgi:hypothetical protein